MKPLLNNIERALVAVGILFSIFAIMEVLRAYVTLKEVHPYAGYAFLVLIALLLGYLVWQVRGIFSFGKVPKAPPLPTEGDVSVRDAIRFRKYLLMLVERFEANPLLKEKTPQRLTTFRNRVEKLGSPLGNAGEFQQEVQAIETENMAPLLTILDKRAEEIIADNVGIVSLGTTLSPYRSIDMYIVLNRNFRMINQIIRVYRSRPSVRETWSIFYDIARVVAAVNLLGNMDNLWIGLGRHIPLVGRYGEPFSEGLFSGLLTSVAGHAAVDRCRSYRPWSSEEAARKYRSKLERWARDVADLLKRNTFGRVFPGGKKKSEDEVVVHDDDMSEPEKGSETSESGWQRFWSGVYPFHQE
ncbi:YcjF family protein [bacterium]|nr:YcjF family protein [bacterium]